MQPNLVTSALSGTISIPAHARSWALSQMPLSVRLEGVLQKMGLRQLGELHGLDYGQISSMRNCGRRTIRELFDLVRRVQEGEFDCSAIHGPILDPLICQVDRAVDDLKEREREILRMRLGDRDRDPMTLEEIGRKFGLTRERARQLLDLMFQRIARHGGPFTFMLLDRLADKCLGLVCPLTPELLPLWLGANASASKRVPAFYVRLFSELDPRIPAWPDGQRPNPNLTARTREIIHPAIEVLRRHVVPMPIVDLYRELEVESSVPNLNSSELLLALKQSASITVTTAAAPDRPVAELGSLRICDWVHQVLSQSDRPLRPEEILRRARRMFGPEIPHTSVGGLRNSLRPEQGIFLLDRRAFGIDRHIRLPERLRAKARSDVAKLLEAEARPVSTREILASRRFDWTAQTNVHELAHLLREDDRFVDLKRLMFGLRSWGQQEREHIRDLIPEVLKDTGHPMTAIEILRKIRRKRSVGRATISAVIRSHQGVREFGSAYYGLKGWKAPDLEFLVAQPVWVRRLILGCRAPLTFAELCARVKIPAAGPLAARLWKTIRTIRRVRTVPRELGADTAIYHTTWTQPKKQWGHLNI